MSWWDYLEIVIGLNKGKENTPSGQSGKVKPSQQLMIENRIKQREKEGIKSG